MEHVSLEEIMKKTKCRFGLVLAAAFRANELLLGEPPLIQSESKKATTIALEELAAGKVSFRMGKGKPTV